jgi:hypothetical protein
MFGSRKKKSRSSSTDTSTGFFAWMGNLAVFYSLLLVMISIPFLILIVILCIRTFMDYHVWILVGMALVITVILLLLIWRRKQIHQQYEEQKKEVMEIIRTAAREGHDVNISFLRGLISLDYQGSNHHGRLLESSKRGNLKALPPNISDNKHHEIVSDYSEDLSEVPTLHIASELEKLSGLLSQGLLTEAEYQELKTRLIDDKLPSSSSS